MSRIFKDKDTGQTLVLTDDGRVVPAERPGLITQGGRQLADIGSGLQMAAGHVLDQPGMIAAGSEATAERNRLFEGADIAYPWESLIGQALPGAATAPLSAGGVMGWLAINAGLGAAESALDVGEPGTAFQRARAGALGGMLGDVGGRVVGRVFNLATAMGDALAGLRLRGNEVAEVAEKLGVETMAYQRMPPGLGQQFAERMTQGAQASMFPPTVGREVVQANEELFNDAAAEAVGVPWRQFGNLGNDWKDSALDFFNNAYSAVENTARESGPIRLGKKLTKRLAKNRQIKDSFEEDGLFEGIMDAAGRGDQGVLRPGEYIEARDSMTDHINSLYNQGLNKRAMRAESRLNELDNAVAQNLPENFQGNFAKLREQYRVFMQLEKPNVINKDGNINVAALNRNLRNPNTGFGRSATAGGAVTNTETRGLIELANAADKPQFAPFKSSGTAENLAFRNAVNDLSQVTQGPEGMLNAVINNAAPLAVPFFEAGGGLPYNAFINQAADPALRRTGGAAGRSLLDEMFYPYVGIQDDRER